MPPLDRRYGRQAFGADPAAYDAARPDYPAWVFDKLAQRCGLASGARVLEIGAGTGKATRRLVELGAEVTAIEPDPRLAGYLRAALGARRLRVVEAAFEDAELAHGAFDLALSATAFHWLDEGPALAKIAASLRPGGWWAALWNVFGDDSREDPFHEATSTLLEGPDSPSAGERGIPFPLDAEARLAALARCGAFEAGEHHLSLWSLVLDPDETVRLYGTYSNINARDDRAEVLAALRRIALDEFGGRVVRNMTTSLFLARRTSAPTP
ncbi:MAG: class I SAM-dependent methyltransferase [Caulobacterales bacterium]